MPTLNYTTTVAVEKTVAEVGLILARHGVTSTTTTYDPSGRADGIGFALRTPHGVREFHLRVAVDGVHALIRDDPKARARGPKFVTREQAERIAWRVTCDWIKAQIALVEAHLATMPEVMLPYLLVAPETTLFDRYKASESAALES